MNSLRRGVYTLAALGVATVINGVMVLPGRAATEAVPQAKAHPEEWDEAAGRLAKALDIGPGESLPDDDPQMRADFLALAKLDPAGALEILGRHPLRAIIRTGGVLYIKLRFYVPGLEEIGRSSPELLADWLIHLDDAALHATNLLEDGADALAGEPDALAKVLAKRTPAAGLINKFVEGSLGWRGLSTSELTERVRNSKQLPPMYCDEILLRIPRNGSPFSPEGIDELLAVAHSSGIKMRILAMVLLRSPADDSTVEAMLERAGPDMALAALCDRSIWPSYHVGRQEDSLCRRRSDVIVTILRKATPVKASERLASYVFSDLQSCFPDKAASLLKTLPDSEWKRTLSGAESSPLRGDWRRREMVESSLTPEQKERLRSKAAEMAGNGLKAKVLEGLDDRERGLLFAVRVQRALAQALDGSANWEAGAKAYIENAPMFTPGERLIAAEDFAYSAAGGSPETAVIWFDGLTGADERESAVKGIIEGWAGLDIHAAAKWLATVKDERVKKAGAEALVAQLTGGDSPLKTQWRKVAKGG